MYIEFLQFSFSPGKVVSDFYVVVTVVLVAGWQIEAIDFNLNLCFFRSLSKYNTLKFKRGRHSRREMMANIEVISIKTIPWCKRFIFKFALIFQNVDHLPHDKGLYRFERGYSFSTKRRTNPEVIESNCFIYLQYSNSWFYFNIKYCLL